MSDFMRALAEKLFYQLQLNDLGYNKSSETEIPDKGYYVTLNVILKLFL